ncbi:MAG: class I SAM-dependent methyltransferase [Candidatus Electrothrix aestuarii]|uniref:Class I SAM-dependent methyltransferase n=1 Tax=Candidatus Electrothrix aestuarii TaxID=3062594 RepID=A0AAU8LSX9_9BACT|nr:class I SAM-dependent methyltransferase [Candidatus Electrothrix aestuarii]
MMDTELESKLEWSYSAKNKEELKQKYDDWAVEYDQLTEDGIGWIGPHNTVEYLKKYITDKKSSVLDAGAGTGFVGEILKEEGYENIVGVDISEGMMNEALKKNAYKEYHLMDLTKKLRFADGLFDAVILVGVFTHGHVGPEILDNIIPVMKKGGYLVFTIRQDFYESSNFENKMSAYLKKNQIVLVEQSNLYQAFKSSPVLHHIEVYQAT